MMKTRVLRSSSAPVPSRYVLYPPTALRKIAGQASSCRINPSIRQRKRSTSGAQVSRRKSPSSHRLMLHSPLQPPRSFFRRRYFFLSSVFHILWNSAITLTGLNCLFRSPIGGDDFPLSIQLRR